MMFKLPICVCSIKLINVTNYSHITVFYYRAKKRRSWFDGQGGLDMPLSYEIAVEKENRPTPASQPQDKQFLVLDHFTAQPKLDFGKVAVSVWICTNVLSLPP